MKNIAFVFTDVTPHGLTSASQSVIWNRMLEKEITVVDLWKLTLYGLNHVNLYNSRPSQCTKLDIGKMLRMAFNRILGKKI